MPPDGPAILRPVPRRPFDINLTSATPPEDLFPPTHESERLPDPDLLDAKFTTNGGVDTPSFSRTRSILNLTSSTLFGIYSPTGYNTERDDHSTPWGTGAQTPWGTGSQTPWGTGSQTPWDHGTLEWSQQTFASRSLRSLSRGKSAKYAPPMPLPNLVLDLAFRSVLLFLIGMGYGVLVTHLHNDQKLAPFQVEGIIKPSYDWNYLILWGFAGVGLGSLLPWIDTMWEETTADARIISEKEGLGAVEGEEAISASPGLGADWNSVVRSIGAFVGIAFAIRKLPWASTLQVSLTLALVNPVLWYLIDRSKPGLLLSTSVAFCGTAVLLSLNPEMMPSPAASVASITPHHNSSDLRGVSEPFGLVGGLVSKDTVECGIWIVSVLFCSCVCFGNIGRRLALSGDRGMKPGRSR